MKPVIVCFVLALGCSCRPTKDNSASAKPETTTERQEAVRKIISARFSSADGSEIKGPLSIEEVETDLDKRGKERSDENRKIIVGGPEWDRMKGDLKPGDELYFFKSSPRSWAELLGWEGYVQVRGETVVHHFPVRMN